MAIKQKVQHELIRLVSMDVLRKVDYSDWAASVVLVNKPKRTCGDFKALSRVIHVDRHPIPTLDMLMEKLQEGKYFSKIDLADVYL